MKNKILNILIVLFIVLSLSAFLYPTISNYFYQNKTDKVIEEYNKEASRIEKSNVEERIEEADLYNEALLLGFNELQDPFEKDKINKARESYARMLELNEVIGLVKIPKIRVDLPIYAGTSDKILLKGVGQMPGSSLPVGGLNTNSVLTAHSGISEKKLFNDLYKLEEGDVFSVENIQGRLNYQVKEIKTIEANDFDSLAIVDDKDLVTLMTCTPIGINTHRLLVIGERIADDKPLVNEGSACGYLIYYRIFSLILLLIIIILSYMNIKKKRIIKDLNQKIDEEKLNL